MSTVADIMTSKVAYIGASVSLHEARNAMKELSIRHLPVVDGQGQLLGMLTQRSVLAKVIALVDQAGVSNLAEAEKTITVVDVMETNFQITEPEMPLKTAAQFFIQHKHSCLPVISQGQLVGIVTSQDFVRLCERLL